MKRTQTPLMAWLRNRIPHRQRVVVAWIAFLALLYVTHALTLQHAVPELSAAKARIRTQKAEIRSLAARLEENRIRLQVAEQEANVVRQANQLLREDESNRQAELNRLQTELDFFQRLAGTSGSQPGLAVYHLELVPTDSTRVFRFVLTLTQNLRRSAIISGNVRFDLEGTLGDRPLTLPWSQITDGSQPEPSFRFKYFQQLDGYLALPPDFEPARLLVSLEVKGQKKPVTRNFDWQELAAGGSPSEQEPSPEPATELEKELPQPAGE